MLGLPLLSKLQEQSTSARITYLDPDLKLLPLLCCPSCEPLFLLSSFNNNQTECMKLTYIISHQGFPHWPATENGGGGGGPRVPIVFQVSTGQPSDLSLHLIFTNQASPEHLSCPHLRPVESQRGISRTRLPDNRYANGQQQSRRLVSSPWTPPTTRAAEVICFERPEFRQMKLPTSA